MTMEKIRMIHLEVKRHQRMWSHQKLGRGKKVFFSEVLILDIRPPEL